MTLEEKGIKLNIPDNLQWEKIDEEDFYRNISQLGLKAVDFVFYGQKKIVLLEVKNYVPNLEGSIKDETLRERKRKRIEKRLIEELQTNRLLVKLANKLVSSIYLVFGKKLKEPSKVIFCVLLLLPQTLNCYLPFISDSLRNLETSDEKLLKINVLVLNEIEQAEEIITSVQDYN
jgi:hypothetical protein